MAENIEAPIKVTLDTSEVDQFSKQWEGRLSSPSQTKMEQKIRDTAVKDLEEKKKGISFQKEWRKGLTGVLIDLHWFRILASQSKVLSFAFQNIGKSLGYLLDMVLLPFLPVIIMMVKQIMGVAMWFYRLPKPLRLLVAVVGAAIVGFSLMATSLFFLNNLLTTLNANLAIENGLLTAKNAALLGPVAAGVGLGLLVVYLLHISGALKAIYNLGVATRKWLDKSVGIPLNFIRQILTLMLGVVTFVYKLLLDIFTSIKDWVIGTLGNIAQLGSDIVAAIIKWIQDSLANALDTGTKIIQAIIDWINSGFTDPVGFVKKIVGIIFDWFNKQMDINTTLVNDIVGAVVDFVNRQLNLNNELVGKLADIFVNFFSLVLEKILNKITESFSQAAQSPLGGGLAAIPGGGFIPYLLDLLNQGSKQSGGFITQTGMYKLHAGEKVVPAHSVGDTSIVINIQGNADQRTIDELTKRLKYELLRVRA